MTLHTSIDGAITEITSVPVGIDGAVVELDSLYAGVDGAKVEIFSAGKKVHNPVKSVTVTGTYSQYASNYGAAITEDGKVVIYTKFTYNTDYEDVCFVDNGMAGDLVYITYYANSSGSTGYYYFAVFEGVTEDIDVTLDFSSRNSSDDYVTCNISSTTASSGRDYKIPDVLFVVSENNYSFSAYDVAYCDDGNIIVLAITTLIKSLLSIANLSLSGLELIDSQGFSRYIYSRTTSSITLIFGAIITGFNGGTITMLVEKKSSLFYETEIAITLTAS